MSDLYQGDNINFEQLLIELFLQRPSLTNNREESQLIENLQMIEDFYNSNRTCKCLLITKSRPTVIQQGDIRDTPGAHRSDQGAERAHNCGIRIRARLGKAIPFLTREALSPDKS